MAAVGQSALTLPSRPAPQKGADAARPVVTQAAAQQLAQQPKRPAGARGSVIPLESRPAAVHPANSAQTAVQPAAATLPRAVFGYVNASAVGDPVVGYQSWNWSLLSTVAYFDLTVNNDGTIVQSGAGWNVWHSSVGSSFLNAAHAHGVRVELSIANHSTAGDMCQALDSVQTMIAQLRPVMMGADGVNIDYEGLGQTCPDGQAIRVHMDNFTRSLRAAGLGSLSVAVYASSPEGSGGFFDIPTLAGLVDQIFVMDYDFYISNGPCGTCIGAVGPLGNDAQNAYPWNVERSAADYAPWASKTILGLPYYGVKTCTAASPPPNASGQPGTWGADAYTTIVTYPGDPNIHSWSGVNRDGLDPDGQEPWASFFSGYANCWREEYWDDAVSLGHKYDYIVQHGFVGAGIFTLDYGGGSPELWSALATHLESLPAAVLGVTACPGNGFASVSWSPAASSSPLRSYTVTASPGGASVTAPAAATSAVVPGLTNGTSYTFTVAAGNAYGAGPASSASNPVTPAPPPGTWPGRFHSLNPVRVLDTRSGMGPLGAGQTLSLSLRPFVGPTASAVLLNVTAVDQTTPSYLSVSPNLGCGQATSNLNFVPGVAVPNLVQATLNSQGSVYIFNLAGSTDVVADLFGYLSADTGRDGHFKPVTPARILDTRLGTQNLHTLGPGSTVEVKVAGPGLPGAGVEAAVLNLTATNASRPSFLSLWPSGTPWPGTSNLNFGAGETRANRVIVPVGADGGLNLFNLQGSTDAVIDVVGYFTDATGSLSGGLADGAYPVRVMDTRIGLGAATLGSGQWVTLHVTGQPGLPASGMEAVVINLTATGPSASGYLEVNASGAPGGTSDVNFTAGETVPNLVVAPVDPGGAIHIFNLTGSTDVVADVYGWYGS